MSEAAVSGEDLTVPQDDGDGHASAEELDALAKENQKLREDIADAERRRSESESQHARDVQYGQLLTENARLKNQLASAEAASEASAVAAGSANLMQSIKDNLRASVEQSKQTVGPVDTNSGYKEPEENLPSAVDQKAAQESDQNDALPDQPGVTDTTSPTSTTPTGMDVDEPAKAATADDELPEGTPAVYGDFLSSTSDDQSADNDTTEE